MLEFVHHYGLAVIKTEFKPRMKLAGFLFSHEDLRLLTATSRRTHRTKSGIMRLLLRKYTNEISEVDAA
jgi:hypothetical protein